MFNMASIVTFVSCFLVCSMILGASSEEFLTVKCQQPTVAQYGTSTLLNCVVQTSQGKNKTIVIVSWTLHDKHILSFDYGKIDAGDPNIQFAQSFWADGSMNVSLLIKNTTLSHAGEYKCFAMAEVGHGETELDLTVKSKYSRPQITSDQGKMSAGKDVTLTCSSDGGFPQGDMKWVVNGDAWKMKPKVEIQETFNGLYRMTSRLSFDPASPFSIFVCEVYNAKGAKESHVEHHKAGLITDTEKEKESGLIRIVAPVLVIGSLIVGLLIALLLCRRRRQKARRLSEAPLMNLPTPRNDEEHQMYTDDA